MTTYYQSPVGGIDYDTDPANFRSAFPNPQIRAGFILKVAGTLQVGASGTALTQVTKYSPALTPASVAANTSAEQTFTVTGLTTADTVIVNKPTAQAGLGIVGVRVSATNTLAINYGNFTAAPITPTAETYAVIAIR